MSQKNWNCSDPETLERAQYIRGLTTARRTGHLAVLEVSETFQIVAPLLR
jgi:hypothetical protein